MNVRYIPTYNLYITTKGNIAFKSPNLNVERSRTPIKSIEPWWDEASNSEPLREFLYQKCELKIRIKTRLM